MNVCNMMHAVSKKSYSFAGLGMLHHLWWDKVILSPLSLSKLGLEMALAEMGPFAMFGIKQVTVVLFRGTQGSLVHVFGCVMIPISLADDQLSMVDADRIFTPQPLRAPGYCRTPSGRAGGRTDGRAGGREVGRADKSR